MRLIDGLSSGQFMIRALFSIAASAAVGIGAYSLIRLLAGLHS
jgi:hypothetical protein